MKTVPRQKMSVTLESSVAAQIKTEAGPGHVSEWMNEAALLRLQGENLTRLMAHHSVTLNHEILAEVAAQWPSDD